MLKTTISKIILSILVVGIQAKAQVGGIAGNNSGTVANSYWNTATNIAAYSASGIGGGSGTANATGRTEADMKNAAFATLLNGNQASLPNIPNVPYQYWGITAGANQSYPILKITPKLSDLNYELPAEDLIYNGASQGISVTAKESLTGFGTITTLYNGSS